MRLVAAAQNLRMRQYDRQASEALIYLNSRDSAGAD
jgi:hypothetical protein